MASIFTLENTLDFSEKINLDELYEKKKQYDLNKLALFNKILNRVHVRIKTTARQKIEEPFCWFVVPEIILGVPKYDQAACIAYLMDKLKENDFAVKYIHPNTLFISWHHFVPSYVRNEWKKRTGVTIDEHGKRVEEESGRQEETNPNKNLFLPSSSSSSSSPLQKKPKANQTDNSKFTPIQAYKPRGHFIYDDKIIDTLETKFQG
jgi:hypothetical protein